MTISMEYYYSSRVVAGFFQKVALLLSFVVRRVLLPCYCWWSSNEEIREGDEAGAEQHRRRHHQLAAAQAVRESLQVATYGEVAAAAAAAAATCAVCLSEVRRKDRVWELRNCCHVFHKACLDRWLDHDEHLTCPLCRAPLLTTVYQPASFPPAAAEPSWAVERLLYLFGDDLLFAPPS